MAKKKASRRPAKKKPAQAKSAASKKTAAKKKKVTKAKPRPAKKLPARKSAAPVEKVQPPATASPRKTTSSPTRRRVSAEQLGEKQREISISEFFTKNRHLLGFDNAARSLLTSIKEAVDNSLDACEEAGILPDVMVKIEQLSEKRFCMTVEDNGPGIVKNQIPKVFGKLLYGSKFHRMRQSRGQQGIGISAAGMYGQLTTGKPVVVTSKTGPRRAAHHYHLVIDTATNRPKIIHEDSFDWPDKAHGTSVSIEMEASYKGGRRGADEYIQTVALANPHVRLEYWRPSKPPWVFPRVTQALPPETKEIKPHPYGVELGILLRMARATAATTLGSFLQSEFSRVSAQVAAEIANRAGLDPDTPVKTLRQAALEKVYQAIPETKIMAPPTNCLAPIGEAAMLEGLKALLVQQHLMAEEAKQRRRAQEAQGNGNGPDSEQAAAEAESKVTEALEELGEMQTLDEEEVNSNGDGADTSKIERAGVIELYGKPCFLTAVTRPPRVYRGNPFQVEAAIAHGGELDGDSLAQVYRFANRVPLLYQQGACAMTQSVMRTNWKSYDVQQSRGALPTGPMMILVHIASVWVPFTSEAKEAVAHYDEIISELKFALQECGRRLARHLRRKKRMAEAEKKRKYIESYIPHIGFALQDILSLPDPRREQVVDQLTGILERSRKM